MSGPAAPERPRGEDPTETLVRLEEEVVECRRCPRLVAWRERVAREKRAAFEGEAYWGRPVPGFGDPDAWLLIVGLAPAAHGANRTGRMFTGDRSGKWLYRALYRAGFANRPSYRSRDDGLELDGAFVTAAVRCAPPENRPAPSERGNCRPYLEREVDHFLARGLRGVVPLGGYAYAHVLRVFRDRGWEVPSPMPDFGHGLELAVDPPAAPINGGGDDPVDVAAELNANSNSDKESAPAQRRPVTVVCSYHPSQQNTFTGTLTEEMFDAVWERARALGPGP